MIRLGTLRKEKGLSQQQLAEQLGLSTSAIGMYERGKREPSHETLREISSFFGVSTDYLLGFQEERTKKIPDSDIIADAVLKKLIAQNALMFNATGLSEEDCARIYEVIHQGVDLVLERRPETDPPSEQSGLSEFSQSGERADPSDVPVEAGKE